MASLFESGIRPLIDEYLLEKSKEKRSYGQYWAASSAGYCHRRLIFERLGVPEVKTPEPRRERVFTSGKLFHDWIQKLTRDAGLSIAQEVELQDEDLMVRGHFDDLVITNGPLAEVHGDYMTQQEHDKNLPTHQPNLILYDYKTQNSRAFSYKRPNMSHYHKMQLGTYMYMLRKKPIPAPPSEVGDNATIHFSPLDATNLTEARILKISKDDLRMSEEQLLWSPELEKEIVGYWTTLNGYWKAKTIPKCTCADYEGGFLAKEQYNGYFKYGEPCSLKYYQEWKAEQTNAKV